MYFVSLVERGNWILRDSYRIVSFVLRNSRGIVWYLEGSRSEGKVWLGRPIPKRFMSNREGIIWVYLKFIIFISSFNGFIFEVNLVVNKRCDNGIFPDIFSHNYWGGSGSRVLISSTSRLTIESKIQLWCRWNEKTITFLSIFIRYI